MKEIDVRTRNFKNSFGSVYQQQQNIVLRIMTYFLFIVENNQ